MYGVIDIGSNTMRLAIYQVKDNKIVPMLNKKFSAGLAGYIDENNCLKESGIEIATNALLEFKELLKYISVIEVFPFATASLRNIDNSKEVLRILKEKTDFNITLMSGDEEAIYDYFGALQNLNMNTGLMIDIGGGSTELVFFKDNDIKLTHSLPIGSLNLYNKFVDDIIPTKSEIQKIQNEVKNKLKDVDTSEINKDEFNTIYAVGGTARAVAKVINRKKKRTNKQDIYTSEQLNKLLQKSINDTKKMTNNILKTCPDRIHTITTGLVALNTITETYSGKDIITSNYGVREGYLHYILVQKGVLDAN